MRSAVTAGSACRMSPMAPKTHHEQAKLGLRLQTLIFSQRRRADGAVAKSRERQIRDRLASSFDLDAQTRGARAAGRLRSVTQAAQPDLILFGRDQRRLRLTRACASKALDVARV